METVEFGGWTNNARLSNDEMELIISADVGPRILRCGFIGGPNVFAEIDGQQGGGGEDEWMIRGGHRLWVAPEKKPDTYELDNVPVAVEATAGGVRTHQPAGALTRVAKRMQITLEQDANRVRILHTLTNEGDKAVELAPWALSVMAVGGMAVIPLPRKVAHTESLIHNQEWSLWGYTNLSDARWTLGDRYVFFRQDTSRGPNKLGIAHREGWVGYLLGECMFVKRFGWVEGATYPDGGVNFETFSNEEFLELESLGPLVALDPGESASHEERWELHRGLPCCSTEAHVDANVLPLL